MGIIKMTTKRIFLPLFEGYFRLRMVWPVWKYVVNMRSYMLWKSAKQNLDGVSMRILHDLETYGIAITHCDELFSDTQMFDELKAYAEHLRQENTGHMVAKEKLSKPFLT